MQKNGKVYYPRLEAEIVKRGILKTEIRKSIGMSHAAFCNKLNGKRQFTLQQGLLIWGIWFPDIPIDELFSSE